MRRLATIAAAARTTCLIAAAALAASLNTLPAAAQSSKTMKIVVPFPPGGSADVLARLVGQEAARITGQTLVVESRPGGGTVIATDYVARSPADGGTLLIMSNSFVINAHVRSSLPYDPLTSFTPVCLLVDSPQLLVVSGSSPIKTFADYAAAAKAKPGQLSLATVGPATTQHIAAELLKREAQLDLLYVAYPGGAPAVTALLGQHVDSVLGNHSEVAEHLTSGALKAIAATSNERLPALPDIPTIGEQGVVGYQASAWFGMMAPAGTPAATISRYAEAFKAALDVPEIRTKLVGLGLYPTPACEAAFAAHVRKKYDEYADVIRAANIKLD
jgi:tripartite-type tricarboxylate transporter receptor subunit TctC